jgi:hypothetical protein
MVIFHSYVKLPEGRRFFVHMDLHVDLLGNGMSKILRMLKSEELDATLSVQWVHFAAIPMMSQWKSEAVPINSSENLPVIDLCNTLIAANSTPYPPVDRHLYVEKSSPY